MTGWVILVDQPKDLPNAETPHKVITAKDYLVRPKLFEGARPKVINLTRSYAYQSKGYYASLLAEARGHRVIPSTETMLELREVRSYKHALPELEDELNRCFRKAGHHAEPPAKLLVCFGLVEDRRYESFARLLFDWFRCPALEVAIAAGPWLSIARIRPRAATHLKGAEGEFCRAALSAHTSREWKRPKARPVAKYSLAVLHDPKGALPPTSNAGLAHLSKVGDKMSVEVELITKKQFHQLAEYDALFIRETTSIENHTYRFARRAAYEGMPVIDDPVSMIRCTNKVYLMELLAANKVAMPPTVMLADEDDLPKAAERLGFPLVVKIPDGSFSRGVHKVESLAPLRALAKQLFEETDLILAQKFVPTEFDWRVGVLGGEPLFVCQYTMAKNHWQIIKHGPNGKYDEGRFKTFAVDQAPKEVVEIGLRAARPIGDGLYGVDIKQVPDGLYVMEVNDNPNLEHGIEDQVLKDELWIKLLRWFIERIEA
jgi:glutathione synthase/RimK-type ligase-like ATP-grasp enzyme